jgi:hypothetical protein
MSRPKMPIGLLIRQTLRIGARHLLGAALLVLLFAGVSSAQLSPGPLSKAHQSLNGLTRCTSCHTLRVAAGDLKCQQCHTEIAQRLSQKKGLHATLVKNPSETKECATCHSEHNGADFNLIRWTTPIEKFDHRQAGYTLEGKHASLRCEQCHAPAHIAAAEKGTIKVSDLTKTFLGLSQNCVSCHQDPHAGRLSTNCTQCHNFTDWKAASEFDHTKTRFPLTGLHAKVECEKCHKDGGAQGATKLSGLAFSSCKDCHQDPHKGSFTQTCDTCHSTAGWKSVRMPSSFDHSKTDYPLTGMHVSVACAQCHTAGDFKKSVAFARCMDCHRQDPHQGQFREMTKGAECSACHTVDTFKTTTYSVKEHAASHYPLLGKHAQVECADCHKPAGTATKFKIAFAKCMDCHKDDHRGQFAAAPHQNRCEDCHAVQGFRPAKFTLTQHRGLPFVLDGAHVAVSCMDCHRPATIAGATTAQFHFTDQTCTACHNDPHDGQFNAEINRVRADGKAAGCQACHTTQTWRNPAGFDHAKTDFPLTGAHRSVVCADCHKPGPGGKSSVFKGAPRICEGCHQDPHAGQFGNADGKTTCANCHSSVRWTPTTFNHNRDAAFSLEGAHQNVECADCHQLRREVNGQPVLFYKPTPTACAACHTDQQVQSPK